MTTDRVVPDYERASLADLLPSVCDGLRVPGTFDILGLGECDRVVVLVVDGLGQEQLQRNAALAPVLAAGATRAITSVFPSTTPAALTSIGTGLPPGQHGLVGICFRYGSRLLWPLGWGNDPAPLAVQPHPTWWERAEAAGVAVSVVSPRVYEHSGLTRSALRGGGYSGADSVGERVAETGTAVRRGARALVYAYWEGLDRTGHVHGPESQHYRIELAMVDYLVARILEVLPSGSRLIVTADHGMLHCSRVVALDPLMGPGVDIVAGEPRMRHVYATPGAATDVAAQWGEELAGVAEVITGAEAIESGLFGALGADVRDRIGDVLAIARSDVRLSTERDSVVSSLVGQHGALTAAEMWVPLAVFDR